MQRELDSRQTPEGQTITIWWDDETDDVQLVIDSAPGDSCVVTVPRHRAHDAFWHPWTYVPVHAVA